MKDASKYFCIVVSMLMSSVAFAQVDPTAPLGYHAPTKVQPQKKIRIPQLDAIICTSEHSCTAVLNGESVTQGQVINGFAIQAIDDNRVVLKRGGKHWSLTIFNEQVVQ